MNRLSAPDAEIVVIGAGLVGSLLALLLQRRGLDVLLLPSGAPAAGQQGPRDPRVLAVTPASRRLLELAGVWTQLPPDRIGVFRGMEVWERAMIRFDCEELGEPALGYIIEAAVLQAALDAALDARGPGTRCTAGQPAGLDIRPAIARLALDDGRALQARLIVGADGRASRSRSLAGIGYLETPYPQQALACVVETEQPHGAVARQRFLADGPLAFLPMAGERQSAIVWSTSPDQARSLLRLPDADFAACLAAAFGRTLGGVTKVGPRAAFPLWKAEARQYCRPRFALVGDAAHSVHPLAGQGANLGWMDAACLAELLGDAAAGSRDPGSLRILRRYERWRRGDNRMMQWALDGLHHLFRRPDPLVTQLRNAGLKLTAHSGPIKHFLMRYAMGRAGDLPGLARREG